MDPAFFRSTGVKYLLPVLLGLASCVDGSSGEKRVDIVLRNQTDRPLDLRAQAGLFSKTLHLGPGEVWRGWVWRQFVGNEIVVNVAEPPPSRD